MHNVIFDGAKREVYAWLWDRTRKLSERLAAARWNSWHLEIALTILVVSNNFSNFTLFSFWWECRRRERRLPALLFRSGLSATRTTVQSRKCLLPTGNWSLLKCKCKLASDRPYQTTSLLILVDRTAAQQAKYPGTTVSDWGLCHSGGPWNALRTDCEAYVHETLMKCGFPMPPKHWLFTISVFYIKTWHLFARS